MKISNLGSHAFFLIILFIAFTGYAQNKGALSGTVVDSVNTKPIPYATVTVFKASDTTIITYRLTDEKGNFHIPALPLNSKARVVISTMGYAVFRKEFTLMSDKPQLDLGKIKMPTSSVSLNEVLIKAERPPVVIRKDTIEFNASAFKTLPDALVEDLLRKLPGVNVDRNGNIMVNGRSVSKIYVDGKDFFGGDTRIATRNLPANVIDKVQVTNDKDALKRDPYMAEADIPQVINLKMKPGIKKGAFGKIYGGGGTQEKFETGGIINLFRDTTQISIIGYGNNVSKSGFGYNDVYNSGGFNRSGWSSYMTTGTGGFAINDISFGGTDQGLQTSAGGGANFNTMFKNKTELNLQYFYGQINSNSQELTNTRQFYSDTTLTSFRSNNQTRATNNHNFGSRIQFKTDSLTEFDVKPNFSFNNNNADLLSVTNSSSNFLAALNKSTNNQQSGGHTFNTSSSLSIDHDFKKKGRNISLFATVDAGNNNSNQYNQANNIFYQPASSTTLNQLRINVINNLDLRGLIRYAEPLSKTLSFTESATIEYISNTNNIETYSADAGNNYTIPVPIVSGNFNRTGWKNNLNTGFRLKLKDFSIQPGLRINSVVIDNVFANAPTVKQRFFNVLPSVSSTYKVFSLYYQMNLREPSVVDLQPIPNNTNPLYIILGNPDLKPALSNYINTSVRKFDTKHSLTYNISINGTITNNATVSSRTVSGTGVQTIRPVNVDGVWEFGNRLSLQKDKKFGTNNQFSLITSNTIGYSRSVVILNSNTSRYNILRLAPAGEFRLNLNDKFEFNQAYSLNYSRSAYQNTTFTDLDITYQDAKSEFIVRPHQNLVFETTLDYRYNSQAVAGLQRSYYKWNAAITYIFLKGRRGQLKLAMNDILDQNVYAYHYVRDNYIQDTQSNTLRRYGMLTFTYNIRNFGAKVGGRDQLLKF
jgi:hypothetical protein